MTTGKYWKFFTQNSFEHFWVKDYLMWLEIFYPKVLWAEMGKDTLSQNAI